MTIDLSYISKNRTQWITSAKSADEAASMNIIDKLIDKIFRGGAKEAAIRALFAAINSPSSDSDPWETADRIQNFLNLRSLMLPEYRKNMTLNFLEHPDHTCDYSVHLNGHPIFNRKDIHSEADIAELRHARKVIQVDDYLISLQGHAPNAASLVHRCDRFLIEQGNIGDCYALAMMIGIMSNPRMHKKIESMAEITENNKLRLKFDVDFSAPNISRAREFKLEQETLARICSDDEELEFMRRKGYDLAKEDGVLRLDISEWKLKKIINETKSAQTNSLIVNILEHFSGNLLLRMEKQKSKTLNTNNNHIHTKSTIQLYNITVRHDLLRSRRNSLLAHDERMFNYDALIANFFGYTQAKHSLNFKSAEEIAAALLSFDDKKYCLDTGCTQGFVYVGMIHQKANWFNNSDLTHAFVLDSIKYNNAKEPTGIYLKNPWGNRKTPEFYSLKELLHRDVKFTEYYPRNDQSIIQQ